MEYPGTKFTFSVRRAMLVAFVTLFLIISPIMILYTAGYRYDWQNGLLRETGAISVDILPKNSTVYLDGVKIKKKIPVRLKYVAPGNYTLKITAPEYVDWVKDIEVKNKQTVYIKEISLIEKQNVESVIRGQIDALAITANNRYLIYSVKKDSLSEVWLMDTVSQQPTVLLRLPYSWSLSIIPAQKNNYVVISDQTYPHSLLWIINTDNPDWRYDLSKKVSEPVNKFEWKDAVDPELFYSTNKSLLSFLPQTLSERTVQKNNYLDWYLEGDQLWTLRANTTTSKYEIYKDTLGFPSLFTQFDITQDTNTQKHQWDLLFAHNNYTLVKNTSMPEMKILTNSKQFSVPGEKFLISKYNDWWLLWTPWELWTYSEGAEPYLLNRSAEQLQRVIPLDKFNTLGLIWANNTTALYPYYLVTHELISEDIKNAAVDSDKRILYFSGTIENKEGLWRIQY